MGFCFHGNHIHSMHRWLLCSFICPCTSWLLICLSCCKCCTAHACAQCCQWLLLSCKTKTVPMRHSVRIPLPHLLALTILWASAPARCHLSGSLGGVSHPPPALRGSRTWGCSTPTDHQDERTRSPCQTLGDCPSWATGAAPPAGSLGRCSRATSGLSLQDPGLRSRFLALPWALTTTWPQNLLTALFCPLRCLVTKLLFRFLT